MATDNLIWYVVGMLVGFYLFPLIHRVIEACLEALKERFDGY